MSDANTPASAPEISNPQPPKTAKGMGCVGFIILCLLIGWIADEAGCNTETPHSDSYQAGFTVGRMEGLMAYSTGKRHATDEELDAVARQTMGGVQFDPANGGLQDWIRGYQSGYNIGWDQAKSGK